MFLRAFRRDEFPFNVTDAQATEALGVLREFSDPKTDLQQFMHERPHIVVSAGRILTTAVKPYLVQYGLHSLDSFEDGMPIPDKRMDRVVDTEHVMVRPIIGNGATQVQVHREGSVQAPRRLNASLPINELGMRYSHSFFIVNHDLPGDVYVRPDDERFAEQLQIVIRSTVQAIERGVAVTPQY